MNVPRKNWWSLWRRRFCWRGFCFVDTHRYMSHFLYNCLIIRNDTRQWDRNSEIGIEILQFISQNACDEFLRPRDTYECSIMPCSIGALLLTLKDRWMECTIPLHKTLAGGLNTLLQKTELTCRAGVSSHGNDNWVTKAPALTMRASANRHIKSYICMYSLKE